MNLELIKEYDSYYLARNEQGEEVKLYKIKQEELDRIEHENNIKVAERLNSGKLMTLSRMLEAYSNMEIPIEKYDTLARQLVDLLQVCYDEIGSPNMFHYYIKNLDPDRYGRAQTFRKETESLRERVKEITSLKHGV